MIELRSDTFTLPTSAMREVMAQAIVGDDVYGEDSTVRELEQLAAFMMGKEASCLMPSGTMANLASIMAWSPRGSKVIVGSESDIFVYEAGGATVCGGIIYEPISTQGNGQLLLSSLEQAFPLDYSDPQFALPALLCLENPHNRCGGTILPLDYLQKISLFARSKGIPIHLDGARIFHAAIASKMSVVDIVQYVDSVQFCLSKGLAAPIGSMVVGTSAFIKKVRRVRKMLGGGMHQAGVIAAAGIVALEQMVDRLEEDHQNARIFAEGLVGLPGIQIDIDSVHTNTVLFRIVDKRFTSQTFIIAAKEQGLYIGEFGYNRLRVVMHYGITTYDVERALKVVQKILMK